MNGTLLMLVRRCYREVSVTGVEGCTLLSVHTPIDCCNPGNDQGNEREVEAHDGSGNGMGRRRIEIVAVLGMLMS